MKNYIIGSILLFLGAAASARPECDAVRESGLRLLPGSTFDLAYSGPLNGCFTGYLPQDATLEKGLYRFGVFRGGKLIVSLPLVEAGMDLASNPYQHLKLRALSFSDLDNDGRRDVIVIGQNLIASGERVFVQVYWGCGERFVFDDRTDSALEEITNRADVSVTIVRRFIQKKKLTGACLK